MSLLLQFMLVVAFEVGGFFLVWFLLRARIRRFLQLENLMEGVREEARALVIELNESADRNVSLVEDRMSALRELLDELDRRMGIVRREQEKRSTEREVYAKLAQRRPIVPNEGGESGRASAVPTPPQVKPNAEPVTRMPHAVGDMVTTPDEPIPLSLGAGSPLRSVPEVRISAETLDTGPGMHEEARSLYRKGFSADIIAARLGATLAEIELLVELEERRGGGEG